MNTRRPQEAYRTRNGFEEFLAINPDGLKEAEALEAQDFARFVMREMGSYFPSLETMKATPTAAAETSKSMKDRIAQLNAEHADGIAKLYSYYGKELENSAMEHYMQTDDLKYFEDLAKGDEWKEHYDRLDNFFRRHSHVQTAEFNNIMERYRYEHLQQLLQLHKRRVELEHAEEEARIIKMRKFPESIMDYSAMESRATRLRVARFLMAKESKKQEMRDASGWVYRQTQPLIVTYETNAEFRREIEQFVKENESRDPRSRA